MYIIARQLLPTFINVTTKMEACFCGKLLGKGLDIATPRKEQLTAYFKRSFAHHTVKNRMPIIITQTIDRLVRHKQEIGECFGKEGVEELKAVIGELSKLKYEIQTNKQIQLLELEENKEDVKLFNSYIKAELDKNTTCTYFNTVWLLAECYMYRKMKEIFDSTTNLQDYDYFRHQKEEAYEKALPLIRSLAVNLNTILRDMQPRDNYNDFALLLKLNLWGNKCDLSLTGGQVVDSDSDLIEKLQELDKFVLSDATKDVWGAINYNSRFEEIDIILDNAGYELFTDLCLADFLISKGFAKKIRFYVKSIPWFVSDVTSSDFVWLIEQLQQSQYRVLFEAGMKWMKYLDEAEWEIEEHKFWTTPYEFKHMFKMNENLFRQLARAKLLIFKGDLNYRKLFGERNWDPTISVEEALEGFHPSRICTLRTLKSDIICGLKPGVAERAEERSKDWLLSGEYGVIQYCGKIKRLI